MFCPNCGKQVKENDKFCRYCGYKLDEELNSDVVSVPYIEYPNKNETSENYTVHHYEAQPEEAPKEEVKKPEVPSAKFIRMQRISELAKKFPNLTLSK